MKIQKYFFLLFLLPLFISCQDDCSDAIDIREAGVIYLNVLDAQTGEDLVFGASSIVPLDSITIEGIDSTGASIYLCDLPTKITQDEDDLIKFGLLDCLSSLSSQLASTIRIDYNNILPTDTIEVEYILGYECEGRTLRTNYNIRKGNEYLCKACYLQPVNLLK